MLDTLRTRLHGAITSPKGDGLFPIRVTKDLARRANIYVGMPLCSDEDLAKRKAAAEKLQNLRKNGGISNHAAEKQKVLAPVTLYFEKNRNNRELLRIEELLEAKGIQFQKRDLTGDEATMLFVTRTAKCKDDDLPVLFVADEVIGNYGAIVAADVSGDLAKKIGL
jgi:ribosome-binding factor A